MDHVRFDDIIRSLGAQASRRRLVLSLTTSGLAVLADSAFGASHVDAKKKRRKKQKPQPQPTPECTPNCVDRACGNDGCGGSCGTCGADQICHGGACCTPESRSATCGGRCGTRTNNCGQPVACATCAAGQECISNGSCAKVCTTNPDCAGTCNGCSNPSTEGAHHCIVGPLMPTVPCNDTTDCPPGSHCQDIGAKVCIELCRM
jgi:hypothetical protein